PPDRLWNDAEWRPFSGLVSDQLLTLLVDWPKEPAVLIRVPLGLPSPANRVPASNPPTKARWELGRRLFFDTSWMTAEGNVSCASCHDPEQGYRDGQTHGGVRTPSLLNCVYNDSQFADGGVTSLEEVIGPSPADEPAPTDGSFRHAWGGVERLRQS